MRTKYARETRILGVNMLVRRPGFVRLIALLCCIILLVPICSPALFSTVTALRNRMSAVKRQGSGDYTDSPGAVDYGQYPLEDPNLRGYFYYPDDLSAISNEDTVEAGAASDPADPNYITNGTADTGDDMVLDGRPAPLSRDQNTGGGGGEILPGGIDDLWAMVQPREPAPATPAAKPETLADLIVASGSVLRSGATNVGAGNARRSALGSAAKQGAGDGGTGGGVAGVGQAGPRAGDAFPWEGFYRAGGSSAAPAYVNTQTGNLLTILPIVGWTVPGGMNLGLTLYHNSQDNLDIGWGMNWRSSFDMRVVYGGTGYTNGMGKAVVTYPTGLRLVFTNPHPATSNVFYPPTGFYDVLSIVGYLGHSGPIFQLRTRDQIKYTFNTGGYLCGINDRYNNNITVNRSSSTKGLTSVVDAAGNTLTFNYVGTQYWGHYTTVTDPTGSVYAFSTPAQTYNPNMHILRSVTFPPQTNLPNAPTPSETFYYGLNATLLWELSRDGNAFPFTFDSQARLTSYSYPVNFNTNPFSPSGNTKLTYTYSYTGTSTTRTDPYGKTTVDNYSGGTLRSQVDEAGYSNAYTWDINYNCSQYKNERGYTSYFGYDKYANMIQAQDPVQYAAGKSQNWTWNSWNDVLTATDTRGR